MALLVRYITHKNRTKCTHMTLHMYVGGWGQKREVRTFRAKKRSALWFFLALSKVIQGLGTEVAVLV